jgi:hypothetical protein
MLRPSQIYPNWEFWFENIPSGSPVRTSCRTGLRATQKSEVAIKSIQDAISEKMLLFNIVPSRESGKSLHDLQKGSNFFNL